MQADPPCLKRPSRRGHTALLHPPNAPTLFPSPLSKGGGSEREVAEFLGQAEPKGEDETERGCGMWEW